jgi:hypothetical protein
LSADARTEPALAHDPSAQPEAPPPAGGLIREGRGINFVEHGEHLPEYVENAAADSDLIERLK